MTKNEREITLGLLNAVHDNHRVTQRSVAKELGVALGLVNAYIKRCIKKGYIKVRMAPANRYAYYLTPAGFAEKSRLTAEYLSQSFNFFRRARKECSKILAHCVGRGWRRVALAGASDLGEIVVLCAGEHDLTLAGFADPGADGEAFLGYPVVADVDALGPVDAVIVTDLQAPQETFERLSARMPAGRVLSPPLPGVARTDAG